MDRVLLGSICDFREEEKLGKNTPTKFFQCLDTFCAHLKANAILLRQTFHTEKSMHYVL